MLDQITFLKLNRYCPTSLSSFQCLEMLIYIYIYIGKVLYGGNVIGIMVNSTITVRSSNLLLMFYSPLLSINRKDRNLVILRTNAVMSEGGGCLFE